RLQVEWAIGEVILDLPVLDRRLAGVDQFNAFGIDIQGDHTVVLRKKDSVGQADIARAGNSNLHQTLLVTTTRNDVGSVRVLVHKALEHGHQDDPQIEPG